MNNDKSWEDKSSTNIGDDIRFQKAKDKKKEFYDKVKRCIIYVIIASLSGAIAAKFIVDYKFENINEKNIKLEQKNVTSEEKELAIKELANILEESVVSISKINTQSHEEFNSGAGTIISGDGYIVTNRHVINNADQIKVKLNDNKVYYAEVIGVDAMLDLAVIKIEATNLKAMAINDSYEVNNGDEVLAIGNPIANSFKENYSHGKIENKEQRVSIVDRQSGQPIGYTTIKNTVKILPGDTGTPLCNLRGEFIGINNNALNYSQHLKDESLAISLKESKAVIDALMQKGSSLKLGLGIVGEKAIPKSSSEGITGIYIKDVLKESNAYEAGLRPTDIIVEVNNIQVKEIEDLNRCLKGLKDGELVECKILKKGKYEFVNVRLGYYRMTN
ncbi:S1C family serine protease [Clostridium ihumii]|uniref:S1C family serine protease n=1 Tax=Clostridium ihumii TaxID=1470356 RepID=UPI00058EBC0E|nr:trypsin-like peptidase domain-containing protein [Clostridium ihumii]